MPPMTNYAPLPANTLNLALRFVLVSYTYILESITYILFVTLSG